ncbi:MAG TPA: hypothetical protein VGN00_16435 [Puia sp.]|jgi:hypothetical protein
MTSSLELYAQGLMGVYELKKIELFRDVFVWAYDRSAQRYAAIRQSIGEPDVFRLKYREEIRALVRQVIAEGMYVAAANKLIKTHEENIPQTDRTRFTEVVETELLSLHDGNFARYGVRPSEFNNWKQLWDKK